MDRPSASGESSARKPTPPVASSSLTSTSASRSPGLVHTRQKNSIPDLNSDRKNGQVSDKRPTRTSKDSLRSRGEKTPEPTATPNENEKLLNVLKAELDIIRTHITCKICYGLLYEPYTTSCGHTYCYTCLCKSFTTSKSCPECRTIIQQPPAPAYLVRELTIGFLKRPELLPKGETLEQHAEWQKEHADTVQRDKADTSRKGGLFRGAFPTLPSFLHTRHGPARAVPILDPIDGVTRCPYCHWELEDGDCPHCGLPFDENGTGSWDDSSAIEGYNPSEGDAASEDFGWIQQLRSDPVLDQDPDYDEEDGFDDMAPDYDDDQLSVHSGHGQWRDSDPGGAMQRYFSSLSHAPSPALSTAGSSGSARRPFHSAMGSRRRSYTASITSNYADTEIGTVEEEDEEDDDSSMSGFINDGSAEGDSQSSSSVVEEPQRESVPPSPSRLTAPENVDDDDEEDSGPVPPSRRRRRADSNTPTPSMSQPSQRRRLRGHMSPHSASGATDPASTNTEEDEGPVPPRRSRPVVQRTLSGRPSTGNAVSTLAGSTSAIAGNWNWPYSPLGRDSQDPGVEGDEESDGGRTTVGWEPNTNSHIRSRTGGSLTPTADRPNPLARPHSRSSNSRVPLGSRGLRRRSSMLSNSTVHYEDNDADDDGSSLDEDGDVDMTRVLRARSSRILRPTALPAGEAGVANPALLNSPRRRTSRAGSIASNFARQQGFGDGVAEVDSDDTDISGRSSHQRRNNQVRHREYDPRISFLFAQHHQTLREVDQPDMNASFGPLDQLRGLNRTPLARPRTSNRNRTPNPSVAQNLQQSPGTASRIAPNGYSASRLRNLPVESQTSNDPTPHSRPGLDRNPSSSSRATASSIATDQLGNPRADLDRLAEETFSSTLSQTRPNGVHTSPAQPSLGSFREAIGRPESRVSHRAPSTMSNRNGSQVSPQFVSMGIGLNTARTWQNRNPFFNGMRPRQSNQRLREQSSTATLRAQSSNRTLRGQQSRNNIHNTTHASPQIRPQASRMHLPSQAAQPIPQLQSPTRQPQAFAAQSRQAVHNSSYNPMRATRPQAPVASVATPVDDDTARRAAALIEQRREEILRREEALRREDNERQLERIQRESELSASVQHVPTTANPFVRGQRPLSQQSGSSSIAGASTTSSSRGGVQLQQNITQSSIQGTQPVSSGATRTMSNINSPEPSVLNPRRASRALPPSTSFVSASSLHHASQQTNRTRSGQSHGSAIAESSMRAALPRGATLTSPTLSTRA